MKGVLKIFQICFQLFLDKRWLLTDLKKLHGYDHASKMHADSIVHTQKFVRTIHSSVSR